MCQQMNEDIFKRIADEIKILHVGAIDYIKKGEYAEAATQYRKALMITEKISYYEGMAITLFNMANLAIVVGDLIEAMKNVADARDMFERAQLPHDHCYELIDQLALSMKKRGIEYEKKGKFQEAIEHFETCIPFADKKSKKAMQHEVELLKKIVNDKNSKIAEHS